MRLPSFIGNSYCVCHVSDHIVQAKNSLAARSVRRVRALQKQRAGANLLGVRDSLSWVMTTGRMVAVFRASDTDPKEVFIHHQAGLGGGEYGDTDR
jgi:hypothetical protein